MSQAGKQKIQEKPEVKAPDPKLSFNPMENAPKGVRVWLAKPDGTPVEAYYYATRQFRGGVWAQTGYWTLADGNRMPIDFEPQGWRWP